MPRSPFSVCWPARRIQDGEIRLACATDAACEGLNLQRLGVQVNIDMPWNPSRLVQRKGRVQRIGQARDNVHVLSLRYAGTVEDEVYAVLSQRFGDIFSVGFPQIFRRVAFPLNLWVLV